MRRSAHRGSMRLKELNPNRKDKEVVVKKIVVDKSDPRAPQAEKSLNVMFNYNGHTWDAYEVLGVPAGSSFESSFQAFEKMTASMDEESKSFLLSALESIRKQKQNSDLQ